MLIDTHAHLDMEDYEEDLDEVLGNSLAAGVAGVITIGIDVESSLRALELAGRYEWIYCSIGFHPHNAGDLTPEVLLRLCELAKEAKVVAWGEIGLDFFRKYSPLEQQVQAFSSQLDRAVEHGLPVIIHSREANDQVLEIVSRKGRNQKGVMHCFSGDYDMAMRFIELGYFISIPGVVTYPNAHNVREVAKKVPIEYLLLETDAPFLAPIPKRGRRNEPQFLVYTARKVAEIREMDFQDLVRFTTENARRLFSIS
ncbi:MAG: TatD family hydrolase [Deltaproteobacteria bacterium]|nr:TatD family hydrolase [Deltaproteobacteria bacterium]